MTSTAYVMVQVDTALVRIVLKHFKWDVEKLLQQWMELGKEKVFKQAGVQLNEEEDSSQQDKQLPSKDDTVKDCEICYGEISPDEVLHNSRLFLSVGLALTRTCLSISVSRSISRTPCRAGTPFVVIAGATISP
jgi:peptidyl-tRNA hydrolase